MFMEAHAPSIAAKKRPRRRTKQRKNGNPAYHQGTQQKQIKKIENIENMANVSIFDDHTDTERDAVAEQPNKNSVGGFSAQAEVLVERITKNTLECPICVARIHPAAAIWICKKCYIIVHLKCMDKYYQTKTKEENFNGEWRCIGCASVVISNGDGVGKYLCFCGKQQNPKRHPYLIPHSCGQQCGKLPNPKCIHGGCVQQCHPGPCICLALGDEVKCPCGKLRYRTRCGERAPVSCQTVCGKMLACGRHTCTRVCHAGPCSSCEQPIEQICYSHRTREVHLCGDAHEWLDDEHGNTLAYFACSQTCNKLLDCQKHKCNNGCHKGPCSPCPRTPQHPQPCACGKILLNSARVDCIDPLPSCEKTCKKPLLCRRHNCTLKCHDSQCLPCTEINVIPCHCGAKIVSLTCAQLDAIVEKDEHGQPLVKCDKVCKVKLSCGKHFCNDLCCVKRSAEGHVCLRTCNKPLHCGSHSCDQFCHRGPCKPCAVIYRQGLSCACGATRSRPDLPCGSPRPDCQAPCPRTRPCGHPHVNGKCHYGDDCGPCPILVQKKCAGGHRIISNIPCHVQNPSCGIRCNVQLACGHLCSRNCHNPRDHTSLPSLAAAAKITSKLAVLHTELSCGQLCGAKKSCGHLCRKTCHPGVACLEGICDEAVIIRCPCGRRTKGVRCRNIIDEVFDCDEQCFKEKRNAQLRSALNVLSSEQRNAANPGSLPFPTAIMQRIVAENMLPFVTKYEKAVSNFTLGDAQTLNFPPMPASQRWLIHQISQNYGIMSESIDREPHRSVRLIRQLNAQLYIPQVSLSSSVLAYIKVKAANQMTDTNDSRVLHVYGLNLSPSMTIQDLHSLLRQWHGSYRLNWLSSNHALIVCPSDQMTSNIRTYLLQKCQFTSQTNSYATIEKHDDSLGPAIFRMPFSHAKNWLTASPACTDTWDGVKTNEVCANDWQMIDDNPDSNGTARLSRSLFNSGPVDTVPLNRFAALAEDDV